MNKTEFYIPRDVHATILKPYQGGWSLHLHKLKLPEVLLSEKIIFTATDRGPWMGSTFQHYAKQGYMGVQLPDRNILLVKESDISFDVPENFEDLREQAEDELEDEVSEMMWSPF